MAEVVPAGCAPAQPASSRNAAKDMKRRGIANLPDKVAGKMRWQGRLGNGLRGGRPQRPRSFCATLSGHSKECLGNLPPADYLVSQEKGRTGPFGRSEEHTSELQSLMRISYAVF